MTTMLCVKSSTENGVYSQDTDIKDTAFKGQDWKHYQNIDHTMCLWSAFYFCFSVFHIFLY